MTEDYLEEHFDEIIGHESDIESRSVKANCSLDELKKSNRWFIDVFGNSGEKVIIIDKDYPKKPETILSTYLPTIPETP